MNEEAQDQITPGPGPAGPGPAQSQSPSPDADADTSSLPSPGIENSQAADTSDREKSWKKRVSTACLACKKSKRKCSGTAPCDNCRVFNRVCIFDESLDQRRRVAAKRTADELSYHRDLLNDLFRVIRAADEPRALRLLDIIRRDASADDIRAYIDETLSVLDSHSHSQSHTGAGTGTGTGTGTSIDTEREERIRTLHDARETLTVEGTGLSSSSFRRKVMDIHFLCDEAPYKVRAAPWTTVTQDDDLVSHLVSLYFTWDYPFYSVLDREVFVRHMVAGMGANTKSDFCSAFLVNAVLANACYFAEVSEAYVVPGDVVVQLGMDFLAEAERLRDQEVESPGMGIGLSSLQGTLLLYERYSLVGDDDLGYRMLHRAIRMGESLGLVGEKQRERAIEREKASFDMDVSLKRTAWGLFHIDTITHTGFLRPSLITKVNLPRIDRNMNPHELWTPYPSHRDPRPAYVSLFFDEACDLSAIAMDISRSLFGGRQERGRKRQLRDDLYERLRAWHDRLPEVFSMESKPPPYILLLRMRYHTLIINLFACTTDDDDVSSVMSDAPQTPESPSSSVYKRPGSKTWDLPQSSAHAIAALVRLHRREYGVSRAHHFALYAVNLALFTLLESEPFDILDPDFLALASSFSVIAGRSHLGRNLFHLFRQSTRSKAQGKRIRDSRSAVPDELKDLFDENAVARGVSRLDNYASGLEKLGQDERYHGLPGFSGDFEGNGLQKYPGLGLLDMLDRYESLSLGKDES